MKYTEKDFTQWHDGDVRPVHDGAYQRDYSKEEGKPDIWYCKYWNGKWYCATRTPQEAMNEIVKGAQDCRWRGLRVKPKG